MNVLTISSQILVNSLISSALYGLMAIGFTIVFGIMRVVNFSHGAFYVLGAYLMYLVLTHIGLPFIPALAVVFIASIFIGMIVEWALLKPARHDEVTGLIITIGLSLVLTNGILLVFGADPLFIPAITRGVLRFGDIAIPKLRVYVIMITAILFVLLYLLMQHTRVGRALRAAVNDFEIATVQGINPEIYYPMGFGLGVGLAALAGALMAPVFIVSPFMGDSPLVMAFVIVILGGLGSVPGLIVASLIVGLTKNTIDFFYGGTTSDIVLFLLILIIMVIRPTGILGKGHL